MLASPVAAFLCLLTASLAGPGAAAAEPETVDVFGRRREAAREERPGQSIVFRPEDTSRFDVKALLGAEPSVTTPETGRISASGFAVPRIRGQDTRLTEVYVEDELLQDPYSGLPLVDELDVRAFGELQHHQGVAPPELATVNPVGILRFRERPLTRPTFSFGSTVGRPYGLSAWSLAGTPSRGEGAAGRVYLRHHQTNGRYPYHEANGTPYNKTDDTTETRGNNDRRSAQVLPIVTYRQGANLYRLMLLGAEAESGVPVAGRRDAGTARQTVSARLATLRVRHDTRSSALLVPTSVELHGALRRDARATEDPSQRVLGSRTNASLLVASRKVGLASLWEHDRVAGRLTADEERAQVDGDGGLAVSRRLRSLYGGASVTLGSAPPSRSTFVIETKHRLMDFQDDLQSATNNQDLAHLDPPEDGARHTLALGHSLALGWRSGPLSAYAQYGRSKRPPSLLEEFGDGGRLRGSPKLAPELIRHAEAGTAVQTPGKTFRLGLAAFQDDVDDRVVFLPVYADTLRARNLERTRIRGLEARTDLDLTPTRLTVGLTRLYPHDLTGQHTYLLPGVAELYGSIGLEQDVKPAVLRLASRYQSQVYRDLTNTIVIPAYWVHDASVDTRLALAGLDTRLGLAVLNLTDVRRLPVAAPATKENTGWSAYSDLDGYPLPGRQWRLSIAAEL